jgi:Domain of unknown function (DUF6438)
MTTRSRILAASMMLCLTTACRSRAAANLASDTIVVRLERGACFGQCAEYVVELASNGAVRFEGRNNVRQLGEQRATVEPAAVQALVKQFADAGFAAADSAYVEGSRGCGQYFTDGPRTRLAAMMGSTLKSVHLDAGCTSAPRYLNTLAAAVDSVARTGIWINRNGDTTP